MDRRKLGWILGLLAGLVLIAFLMPCGSKSKSPDEARRDQIRKELEREIENSFERASQPPAVDSRFAIEQRLERMRDERNKAQQLVDRASRGEEVDPAQVETARKTVADLIPRIEADERALRELDAE